MEKVLFSLRANTESTKIINGEMWGTVYLDNAHLATISANQFAGFLSALKQAGLYQPTNDECFGLVKM